MAKQPTAWAARMKQAAGDVGLTADELGERLGVTGAAVRHWWGSRSEPSFGQMERYAQITGRTIYWFLTGENDPQRLVERVTEIAAQLRLDLSQQRPTPLLAALDLDEEEGPSLREYLAGAAGADWLALSDAERETILSLVWLYARQRQQTTRPRTPSPAPGRRVRQRTE